MPTCNKNKILEVFRRFITNDNEIDAVRRGEPILTTLSIDSLTMVHMVSDIEKEFDMHFDYETIEHVFENLHTLENFLCRTSTKDP
jgi:acyl carrier protein